MDGINVLLCTLAQSLVPRHDLVLCQRTIRHLFSCIFTHPPGYGAFLGSNVFSIKCPKILKMLTWMVSMSSCALLPKDWCLAMIWCFVNGQFVTSFFLSFFTEAHILGPFSCLNRFSFFSLWKILKLLKWMVCCPPVHSWPKPRLVLCQRRNFHRVFLAPQDTHKVTLLSEKKMMPYIISSTFSLTQFETNYSLRRKDEFEISLAHDNNYRKSPIA